MKILLISFEFPPQGGGIGTYSYQIANNLSKFGVDLTALVISHHVDIDQIKKFDAKQGFRILRFTAHRIYLVTVLSRIIVALKEIFRYQYDLIFIAHYAAGIIGLLAKVLKHKPYVLVGHGTEYLMKDGFRFHVTNLVHKYADCILLNSNYTLGLLQRRKIAVRKSFVTHLGADHVLFNSEKITKPEMKKKLQLEKKFILLTVGSLSPRKNHRIVIDSLKKLSAKYSDLHYLIVGTGPLREELENYSGRLGLSDMVSFIGHVNIDDLPNYYNIADVFILTSKTDHIGDTEGFGIVFIEASLMRKPVIGSDNGGIPEAIEREKSGLIVPTNDLNETVNAIEKLYLNPDLRMTMGSYGYSRARRDYTWDATARKTLDILNTIIHEA